MWHCVVGIGSACSDRGGCRRGIVNATMSGVVDRLIAGAACSDVDVVRWFSWIVRAVIARAVVLWSWQCVVVVALCGGRSIALIVVVAMRGDVRVVILVV